MSKEYFYNAIIGDIEEYATVVQLTESEHKAVQKFLRQLSASVDIAYCEIGNIAYENKQDCLDMKFGF